LIYEGGIENQKREKGERERCRGEGERRGLVEVFIPQVLLRAWSKPSSQWFYSLFYKLLGNYSKERGCLKLERDGNA
jgi:hypothetical protein